MKCGYIRHTWTFGDSLEIEEKHTGRYGAPGIKRGKKKKATPEDIKRQNQWKKERDIRRIIKWNFRKNDYWTTLTYKKGERPSWEAAMDDIQKLLRKLRTAYRKYGKELKYIYRISIGRKGGLHIHLLINRFSTEETGTDIILSELWTKGHVNFKGLYEAGGYKELASYLAKPLEEWEPEKLKRFHPSRNMIKYEPEKSVIRRRALIDRNGQPREPKAPKGYYVDPDSIRTGINIVTGFPYRHYTLIKLDRRI